MNTSNNLPNNIPKLKSKKNRAMHLIVLLLILSLSINIFFILKTGVLTGNSISGNSFRYINPVGNMPIDANTQSPKFILQYKNLLPVLNQEISNYNATGNVGIYLQDAQTGAWLGINERTEFIPASLLKTPVMIAILKKIQNGEMTMNDQITLTQSDLNPDWGTLYQKGAGAKITVSELLEEMMADSDNTAKNALIRQLTLSELDAVFFHVGISDPYINNTDHNVSPRGYERLFKSLYYSTYLSPKLSEIGMELTMYDRGEDLIAKGVPAEVQVSHKFGIYWDSTEVGTLSDCGIVYHAQNPYFLCIMTKNLNLTDSGQLIPQLSKDIYDYVDKGGSN